MGVDPLSPIAPVRLRALLLPVGKIKRSRFLSFAARLQAENIVRLGDVSPDARPNRNLFSPLAFPTGMILYDLDISVPPTSHLDLFPFEIFREPLAIIAIADGTELQGNPEDKQLAEGATGTTGESQSELGGIDKLLDELSVLKENYPKSLVHELVVFDHASVDKPVVRPENVIWVPSVEASRSTTMKTVMCDISSLILGELDEFAKTMQNLPVIDSPRESSWGPRRTPDIRDKRMTMPAQLPSRPNGVPDPNINSESNGTSTPRGHESPTTFDEITRSIQLANRASAALKPTSGSSSKEHSRERKSVQGLGSVSASDRTKNRIKGRLNIVMGSLFLHAGRWPDALKELVEGAGIARASSDYVWHGKALEYILLCLLMFGWAGMDFQIPQICYPIAEKSTSKSSQIPTGGSSDVPGTAQSIPTNRLVSLQNLTNLLPDLSNNILNLYTRAAHITEEPVPQLIFSETAVRLSKLLAAVHIRDGTLDDQSLRHIVVGEPLTAASNSERPRGAIFLRKSDMATFLYRALPLSPNADVPVTDLVPIYAGMASVLSALGLQRRKVFILKELLAVLVPGLVQARKIGAAEIGIHPASGLSALSNTAFAINALDIGPGNMEDSMRSLLGLVSESYGVQRIAGPGGERRQSADPNGCLPYDSIDAIVERAIHYSALNSFGDLDLKIEILRCCINFCEALPDFHGVLKFTVELLQTIRGVPMLGSENSRTVPVVPALPREEQIRLLNNIKRTVGATNKLGLSGLEAEYWDEFLVRGIEALDMRGLKKPVQRSRGDVDAAAVTEDGAKRSPFIYNPFSKAPTKVMESLVVSGEAASFKVTLQNPYEFELEVESIQLEGEGVPFKAAAHEVWIAPFSLQEIIVSGVAEGEGTLKITGCTVKVRHCRERRFPIFKKPWKPHLEPKTKRTGLAAKESPPERPTSWDSTTSTGSKPVIQRGPEADSCSVKVIGAQPTLVIQSTSLSQSAIMVLEGETTSFTIRLQNTSTCPVDMILFTFQDSTTRQIQSALSNKDIPPTEQYELELQLATKPALRWRREGAEDHSIAPGEISTFTIEVLGKPGLHDAVVQIDYSHVGVPHADLPDTFYTRQLLLPLTITVNASIEVSRCDISLFTGDFAWFNQQQQHKSSPSRNDSNHSQAIQASSSALALPTNSDNDAQISSMLSRVGSGYNSSDHCLLLLDLRNAWPNPLSISLEVNEAADFGHSGEVGSTETNAITEDLQPGHISRFVLILPRIYLDKPHTAIPSLNTGSKRQFVVSANKLTFEAEAADREAFWFREELLKRIHGTWRESTTGRKGAIELRGIRFSSRMVDAIRLEPVDVSFSISSRRQESGDGNEDDTVTQTGRSKFTVKTSSFLNLTATIHNRSSRPVYPLLRLQPSLRNQPHNIALDLTRRFICTGMLQHVLPILGPQETTQSTLGITALCRGEYEIGATVEEVKLMKSSQTSSNDTTTSSNKTDQQRPQSRSYNDMIEDAFDSNIKKERRVWHAREPCIISARD